MFSCNRTEDVRALCSLAISVHWSPLFFKVLGLSDFCRGDFTFKPPRVVSARRLRSSWTGLSSLNTGTGGRSRRLWSLRLEVADSPRSLCLALPFPSGCRTGFTTVRREDEGGPATPTSSTLWDRLPGLSPRRSERLPDRSSLDPLLRLLLGESMKRCINLRPSPHLSRQYSALLRSPESARLLLPDILADRIGACWQPRHD